MQNQKNRTWRAARAVTSQQKRSKRRAVVRPGLLRFDRQDLPAFIITARWTGRVRGDGASALGAFIKLRRLPAVRGLACAQPHLRSFAFGNSHRGNQESRKSGKHKSTASTYPARSNRVGVFRLPRASEHRLPFVFQPGRPVLLRDRNADAPASSAGYLRAHRA
jgi:hypothetical protein